MKNVLFATTALVAMAGAATAQSISWGGDATVGYNDVIEGGVFANGTLTVKGSVDLGDNVTASASWDAVTFSSTGVTALGSNVIVAINFDNGTLNAGLTWGDLNDKGASERYYADRSGMAVDVENQDNGVDVVATVGFGNFNLAVGCGGVADNVCDGINIGAGATFGSIKLGIGYDVDSTVAPLQRGVTAVSVDATFGSIDVGVSYATGAVALPVLAETSIGVKVGTTFGAVKVGAYYASNTVANDEYGFSADYSAGALSVGAYYDNNGVGSYGVDLAYDVTGQLTVSAGLKNAGTMVYYVGIDYAVNDNISATVSYATANIISGPKYKDGITALITASF